MKLMKLLSGAALLVAFGAGAMAQTQTPAQIIVARQTQFKKMGDNFEAIKKSIDAGTDIAGSAPLAQFIADWAHNMPAAFPPGSDVGAKTRAQPTIWTDRATFEENATNLNTQATKLAEVMKTNDKAASLAQYQLTGRACGACHANNKFRGPA